MDLYTFKVDQFHINNTRALHNDTLHLAYSAYVDGGVVAQQQTHLGDFNNGTYVPHDPLGINPNVELGPVVINDPTSTVAFNYQLVNAFHGASEGRMSATADALAGILPGLGGAQVAEAGAAGGAVTTGAVVYGALWFEALATLYAWLSEGCDGPVAVDQISGPRYFLDAWADQTPTKSINVYDKYYPGSPTGRVTCNNHVSEYNVTWSLHHRRTWLPVRDRVLGHNTSGIVGLSAAVHNGAVHAVGLESGQGLTSYRTYTGRTWDRRVATSSFVLSADYLSAVSFNDRLYVFAIQADGSVKTLVYTVDGGSWTPFSSGPSGLLTNLPFATVEFRNRLYIFARDSATNRLRLTSTDDMLEWSKWSDVPERSGIPYEPALAAVSLDGVLHVFGVYRTQGPGSDERQLLHNSTTDPGTWDVNRWRSVERAATLPGSVHGPLDVAANIFQNRIYLASRWEPGDALAVNFSGDGDNWSGWRIPESEPDFDAGFPARATVALAPVNNHLYLFATDPTFFSLFAY